MDYTPSDDQVAIRDAVNQLMQQFPDEYWAEKDREKQFPWEFYNAFAAAGFLGMVTPVEYGGSGLGLTEAAIALAEVVGASGGGLSAATAVHVSIFGLTPVVKFGSEEMRHKYLPQVISGDLHVCFGVTEPDAGTDTTRIKTTAQRDGNHWVVNGRKVWTSKALESQKCLLLTRTTPIEQCAKKSDGMTLFLVDIQRPEVTIRPIPKMGREAVASCEVFYDNLPVDPADMVGEEGKGFQYLLDGLNAERILVAWEAVALGRCALRRAVTYANDRKVFGRAIGMNQGVQFPLAESLAKLEAAQAICDKAAWLYDNDLPCGDLANIAKYLATEAGFEACDRAVQTHGGYGYAQEYHVERYFRESRVWRIAPISQNFVLSYISERMLHLPRSF
ncbi:acyl-CoA/acyl-ACP dehydrogenase [Microvirga sp. SRT01]|uniref:Acyl-CoA/acyl-ACP dehydrogenase n=1 Tax=Sphingomonas longa TaxID=2778730 RepID=A0ABS2DA73_9SPHN|nr:MULTISPECIES: acyl-CoA dehydrogenase family protein [Alphaproteobacteria]MBM6577830.1 acyl-CoA/acyl-ACP dehydrogenase [Sphingomonas sp. BT552]MBR7710872.1 acyl-CoA/acyl-ACP dehydrogenase [Microvirga sp. SRT01]